MVQGTGCETVGSVQAGSEECLTLSNRYIVHVTGIVSYIKTRFKHFRKIAKRDYQLRHICLPFFFCQHVCLLSVLPSVHSHMCIRPTGRIFMKLIF
jgi:hypothetical protein